jgi:maltooligosyltrehalose trehalohydrolase
VPDPQDPATFERSRLDWKERTREPHARLLAWYKALIHLRRSEPALTDPRLDRVRVEFDEDARWLVVTRGELRVAANLAAESQDVPVAAAEVLLAWDPKTAALANGALHLPARSLAVVARPADLT